MEQNSGYAQEGEPVMLLGSLEKINARLTTILNSISDGVYITDGNAVTVMINQAYESISGLKASQVLGKSMRELVSSGVIDRSGTLAALESRHTVTLEQTFRTGKQVLVTSTPCLEPDGDISMVITVVRDMTELYDLQAKCRESEERYRREVNQRHALLPGKFIAADPKTVAVLDRAGKVAALNTTVLLLGETGVGKELFARFLFENSSRSRENFISINCGAIPPSLIESEFFGYERGAFTGASREGKLGIFESANHGTVFLDEIGDLPLDMQVHLLRILQEMRVKRIGSVRTIPVDVRVIAATNRNLWEMVQQKTFREDLYYRLNVVPIEIPPLRERRGDIIPLVRSFLSDMNQKYGLQKRFSASALQIIREYNWPGNVRELRNAVEQAVILSGQNSILPADLPIPDHSAPDSTGDKRAYDTNLKLAVIKLEYSHICKAYERHGNVRDAAASLGMDASTFVRKRKKYRSLLQK